MDKAKLGELPITSARGWRKLASGKLEPGELTTGDIEQLADAVGELRYGSWYGDYGQTGDWFCVVAQVEQSRTSGVSHGSSKSDSALPAKCEQVLASG
jgi:hypothetical protein